MVSAYVNGPLDAVRNLSLKGTDADGNAAAEFKIRNICCVGAGYVGTSSLIPPWLARAHDAHLASNLICLVQAQEQAGENGRVGASLHANRAE